MQWNVQFGTVTHYKSVSWNNYVTSDKHIFHSLLLFIVFIRLSEFLSW